MQINYSVIIIALLFFVSCKNTNDAKWSELPEITDIEKLKQTEFVSTLESPFDKNKNTIYAPSLLYAWDKVKEKLDAPISLTDTNSNEFHLLNQSSSHKNSLTENEYSVEAEVVEGVIIAKAFFNKTLPFPSRFQKLENPLSFGGTKVSAFGINNHDEEAIKFTEILYYKNDDHFIVRFRPKDPDHEIILTKGITPLEDLFESVNSITTLMITGNIQKNNPQSKWKYDFNNEDILSIPIIQFNIVKNYNDIERQTFKTNGKSHHVETAYQRTGFILNEKGAVVESEAIHLLDSSFKEPIIQSKKMVFDKPFFIFLKRTKSDNPYFVMYVQNSELMTKQ